MQVFLELNEGPLCVTPFLQCLPTLYRVRRVYYGPLPLGIPGLLKPPFFFFFFGYSWIGTPFLEISEKCGKWEYGSFHHIPYP